MKILLFIEEQAYCLRLSMKYLLHLKHREVHNKASIVCKMHKIGCKMKRRALNTVNNARSIHSKCASISNCGEFSRNHFMVIPSKIENHCVLRRWIFIECTDKWLQDKWLPSKKLVTNNIECRTKGKWRKNPIEFYSHSFIVCKTECRTLSNWEGFFYCYLSAEHFIFHCQCDISAKKFQSQIPFH